MGESLEEMLALFANQTACKLNRTGFDNIVEYIREEYTEWLKQRIICINLTLSYSPESSGNSERLDRTLNEKVRTLFRTIQGTSYSRQLWAEAVNTAN